MSTLTHQPGWVQARCQSSPTLITHKQQQTIFSSSPLSSSLFRAGWVQHANGSGTKHGVGKHTMRSRAAVGGGLLGWIGTGNQKNAIPTPEKRTGSADDSSGAARGRDVLCQVLVGKHTLRIRSVYAPVAVGPGCGPGWVMGVQAGALTWR